MDILCQFYDYTTLDVAEMYGYTSWLRHGIQKVMSWEIAEYFAPVKHAMLPEPYIDRNCYRNMHLHDYNIINMCENILTIKFTLSRVPTLLMAILFKRLDNESIIFDGRHIVNDRRIGESDWDFYDRVLCNHIKLFTFDTIDTVIVDSKNRPLQTSRRAIRAHYPIEYIIKHYTSLFMDSVNNVREIQNLCELFSIHNFYYNSKFYTIYDIASGCFITLNDTIIIEFYLKQQYNVSSKLCFKFEIEKICNDEYLAFSCDPNIAIVPFSNDTVVRKYNCCNKTNKGCIIA